MKRADIICQDYHFYPNGIYSTTHKYNLQYSTYDNDLTEISLSIRLYGTQEQIDKALNEYMERTQVNLDESYNFKVEPKGSYWYDIYGSKAEEINKKTQAKLDQYKKIYQDQNDKALLINLR
tara:strand:+ start:38 stop:403 length:366 start_codon:yes stop_codon:yes gene_type:complete